MTNSELLAQKFVARDHERRMKELMGDEPVDRPTCTFTGPLRFSFNRAGAAPLVWSIATEAFEIAVRAVTFKGVEVQTVYAPKETPDDEDGKPSAYLVCTGTVNVYSDGRAEVVG